MAVAVPTGADLAAYMARSDPGDFDLYVAAALDNVTARVHEVDPFTEQHRLAVLATAAGLVLARHNNGVDLTEMGPVYARRRAYALDQLLTTHAAGGFA